MEKNMTDTTTVFQHVIHFFSRDNSPTRAWCRVERGVSTMPKAACWLC